MEKSRASTVTTSARLVKISRYAKGCSSEDKSWPPCGCEASDERGSQAERRREGISFDPEDVGWYDGRRANCSATEERSRKLMIVKQRQSADQLGMKDAENRRMAGHC